MSDDRPEGPVVLWHWSGEGWSHDSFADVRAALQSAHGYTDRYVITRLVDFDVIEKPASPPILTFLDPDGSA